MPSWRDVDNFLEKANSGDVVVMDDYAAIDNSLANIFQTMQGSRRMLPDFALAIYRLLFEPVDALTAGQLADYILQAIIKWETRIQIEGLTIDARPDEHTYIATLEYRIVGTSDDDKLKQFNTVLRAQ